ncbi:glycoside hydrolase family 3 protein [Microlunatus spumicola]|uniref:Glycoside hydrolase family 3 protein n=1 Tax=Microlunatus spumicola TaxID=81499 RepID=A0ABP6XGR0_9ACTN
MTTPTSTGVDVLPTLLPGFSGTTLPDWVRRRLREGLGGVCLFARNITDHDQLAALNAEILAANPRAVVALDEEGGDVTRLFADVGSPYPGNAVLGRLDDLAATEAVAAEVGRALRRTGCTLTFAPDVDVNNDPDNPVIGVRSFGDDAVLVARHGAAWTRGVQATGIGATAKHFPGHGDTATDSHLSLPVVDRSLDELRERELVPFAAAVRAGTVAVMTSHILLPQVDPDVPATFSRAVATGLLREELGFTGVLVTDALDMAGASSPGGTPESAVRALAAGCDLLCLGNDNTDAQVEAIVRAVRAAVADGSLDAGRVAEAVGRVHAMADTLTAARAARPEPPAVADEVADDRLAATFDVSPSAVAWRDRAGGRFGVVRLEEQPNIAVGVLPWGPDLADHDEVVLRPGDVLDPGALVDGPVLVLGRDVHRHPEARATVDRLRSVRDVLVVDLGWPSPDRAYADVATFGASRRVGRALLAWLREG